MKEITLNNLVLTIIKDSESCLSGEMYNAIQLIISEARRVRWLVQCCGRDYDFVGNCDIHSGKFPVERMR